MNHSMLSTLRILQFRSTVFLLFIFLIGIFISVGFLLFSLFLNSRPVAYASPLPATSMIYVALKTSDSSATLASADKLSLPFNNNDANKVASDLGIGVETFFLLPGERDPLWQRLTAISQDELLPIYFPAVTRNKDVIYEVADKYNVPPNTIAILMAVESAGHEQALSYAGAVGLLQPMPDKFPEDIQNIRDDSERFSRMQEPLTNAEAGISYFKEFSIPYAQRANKGKAPAVIYGRAATLYNGGHGRSRLPFDKLPSETKWYYEHFMRYVLLAEIAQGLREKGFSDREIVKKLAFNNIDPYAYSLQMYVIDARRDENFGYKSYKKAMYAIVGMAKGQEAIKGQLTEDEFAEVEKIQQKLYVHYLAYTKGSHAYTVPVSPAARIWISIASFPEEWNIKTLYEVQEANVTPDAWFSMTTERGSKSLTRKNTSY